MFKLVAGVNIIFKGDIAEMYCFWYERVSMVSVVKQQQMTIQGIPRNEKAVGWNDAQRHVFGNEDCMFRGNALK